MRYIYQLSAAECYVYVLRKVESRSIDIQESILDTGKSHLQIARRYEYACR